MLARQSTTLRASDYVSDRVYTGPRPIPAARLAILRDNYRRTHTMPVFRFAWINRVTRALGFKTC